MKKSWKITALLLGVVFDILFWEKSPGISFAIFIALSLIAGSLLSKAARTPASKINLYLYIPIIFFSVMSFIRQDPMTTFLNYALSVGFSVILIMTFQIGQWGSFNLIDYITNLFQLAGSVLKFPLFAPSKIPAASNDENESSTRNTIWPIIRGLLMAVPILFIFIALFSSADLIFNERMTTLFSNLKFEKLPEYIFRGIIFLMIANLMNAFFIHAAEKSGNKDLSGMNKPSITPFLGFTETCIILGSVLLLFLSFIGIQFRYFFFGDEMISQTGFTYAEYARRGFGELVAVAVFSLILLIGLNTISKRVSKKERSIFSWLFAGLVGAVLIILVSAFQRLLLYETAYGFSQLRTYSHVFMIWLSILLVAVVLIEIINRPRIFGNAALLAVMGFTITLNFLNVDAFITNQNINRTKEGNVLDISYLTALTHDAVPVMVKTFLTTSSSSETHMKIGAALTCFKNQMEQDKTKRQAWQSFHIADWRANQKLLSVSDQLSGYHFKDVDRMRTVVSPDGIEYTCERYLGFD